MDLKHVMLISDAVPPLDASAGTPSCVLFNANKISKAQAIQTIRNGTYSPYVLSLPKEQFLGLFRDEDIRVDASNFLEDAVTDRAAASPLSGTVRSNLHPGDLVDIVLKKDQPTGVLTRGRVKDILTNSPQHYRGIKVRLQNGQVGRVHGIIESASSAVAHKTSPTRYELIKNMTFDSMSHELIPLLMELCEDGVPCEEYIRDWLSRPEEE